MSDISDKDARFMAVLALIAGLTFSAMNSCRIEDVAKRVNRIDPTTTTSVIDCNRPGLVCEMGG